MSTYKIVFIPVSSPSGIGEYMRSLTLAKALAQQLPQLDIHFVLNKHTQYAASCPFNTTLLNNTPTKDNQGVCKALNTLRPNVVVFDCSGRAKQMQYARKLGAKVVFFSQHEKKRARGLKLNRIRHINKHYVVQPDYCIAPLSAVEKLKINWFNGAKPQNIGAFFFAPSASQVEQVCALLAVKEQNYVVFNGGSGGHKVEDKLAADVIYQGACDFSEKHSYSAIMVFGNNYPHDIPDHPKVITLRALEGEQFIALLKGAKAALISAGDTLLQAIDMQVPTAAVAVSKDQPKRLAQCVAANKVLGAELNSQSINQQLDTLINRPVQNTALSGDKSHAQQVVDEIIKLIKE